MFNKHYEIDYSDKDVMGFLKPHVLLNYLSNIATINASVNKFGYKEVSEKNCGWFVLKYALEFDNYPECLVQYRIHSESVSQKFHEQQIIDAVKCAIKTAQKNGDLCEGEIPEFKDELNSHNTMITDTLKYAQKLEGNVRNTGVHACGVIICRDDITDWVPVSTADDKENGKLLVTQFEGRVIEETGLIKMDFLGLKTLSIIKEAIANIKLTHGIDVDIDTIDIEDKKTYQLYCEGRTTGTFQFESAGMQKYLRELQPTTFEDLIAMNALYRPGPMDYIPDFIARKHGRSPIVYDIPIMEKYLKDTYGITVYQEQVMLLSRLLADFTRGQSDTLRKAMGKKMIDKMNELKALFIEGGKKNGHDPKVLEKIWADWEKFASYAFNKSHATCYSWVAFQTAYLKANYPAEYMAAVLSRNSSDITKLTGFMDECKKMHIPVKGPDVNESFNKFGVNKKGEIRFGLSAIKGVGEKVANCVMLFGLGVMNSFPVDTWINKVYNKLTNTVSTDRKRITKELSSRYGNLSGYAQQYFFYYFRENRISN